MITAGVDVGTRFLKICIAESSTILGSSCRQMNGNFKPLYKQALSEALFMAGSAQGRTMKARSIEKIIATGYGSHLVKKASSFLRESACIARGAHALDANIRTVIDAGGLFIRIITIGTGGFLEQSYVNEKCAAGSGKFLEMISEAVDIPFDSITETAHKSSDPFHITASCAVFAESDVISHVNNGRAPGDILAGVINSIASKTTTLLEGAGADDVIVVTGGLSRVTAFVESLNALSGRDIQTLPIDPHLLAAYGGALLAQGPTVSLHPSGNKNGLS